MFDIINPRQTVLVTSQGLGKVLGIPKESHSIITLDWHMPVSKEPFMYAIAVGYSRFSYQLIKSSGVFAVNFIPFELKSEAIVCGTKSGEHHDKFEHTNLTKIDSDTIECPRIREASATLECQVVNEVDTGDHAIFIGKVTGRHINNSGQRLFHTSGNKFSAL